MKDGKYEASDFTFGDGDFSQAIAKEANALLSELRAQLLTELLSDAQVIYVKLPTDFHPQHKQNGMVSTEPVEGWQLYVSLKNNSVVCDGCKVCMPTGAEPLNKWLVVTKNISEIGDPKSRFVHREYYCFNCRGAHE